MDIERILDTIEDIYDVVAYIEEVDDYTDRIIILEDDEETVLISIDIDKDDYESVVVALANLAITNIRKKYI